MGFLSHTTREGSVPVFILSKVTDTQLVKSDWIELDWKKAVYRPLIVPANTLLVVMIFMFVDMEK